LNKRKKVRKGFRKGAKTYFQKGGRGNKKCREKCLDEPAKTKEGNRGRTKGGKGGTVRGRKKGWDAERRGGGKKSFTESKRRGGSKPIFFRKKNIKQRQLVGKKKKCLQTGGDGSIRKTRSYGRG